MSPEFKIREGRIEKNIGPGHPTFIIAEMSGNHNQDINRAYAIIDAAADAGVDAVKLQTYTADTLTLNVSRDNPNIKYFMIGDTNTWAGQTLYELYQTAYTPWEWQPKLKEYGEKKDLIVFSTPFDVTAVDFLQQKMDVELYKISSFESTHTRLLKKVAQTGKPVILSRGLASIEDIQLAIDTLESNGCPALAILHCVSSYPALPKQMNLAHISDIRERFGVIAGLSDHSLGIEAATLAVGEMKASVIEKHFTLKRSEGGPDASFSLEPDEMKELVHAIREIETNGFHPTTAESKIFDVMRGSATYTIDAREQENIVFKTSIIVQKDIKKGETFTEDNIIDRRPGYGLPIKEYPNVLGKKAAQDIQLGTPLSFDLIAS